MQCAARASSIRLRPIIYRVRFVIYAKYLCLLPSDLSEARSRSALVIEFAGSSSAFSCPSTLLLQVFRSSSSRNELGCRHENSTPDSFRILNHLRFTYSLLIPTRVALLKLKTPASLSTISTSMHRTAERFLGFGSRALSSCLSGRAASGCRGAACIIQSRWSSTPRYLHEGEPVLLSVHGRQSASHSLL